MTQVDADGEGQSAFWLFWHISIVGAEDNPDWKRAYLWKHAQFSPQHACPGELKSFLIWLPGDVGTGERTTQQLNDVLVWLFEVVSGLYRN